MDNSAWIHRKDAQELGENQEFDALNQEPVAFYRPASSTKSKSTAPHVQAAQIVRRALHPIRKRERKLTKFPE